MLLRLRTAAAAAALLCCSSSSSSWLSFSVFAEEVAAAADAAAAEPAAAEPAAAEPAAAAAAAAAEPAAEGNIGSLMEMLEGSEASKETHQYQAEVTRLMDIIINSLYTQREVFLRELVSNAADALEKARFAAISEAAAAAAGASSSSSSSSSLPLEIRVAADKANKVLTICDSGIGMNKEELITNLGTVAKSGTSNFVEALAAASSSSSSSSDSSESNLIGQFGVGFYAAFLVADRVTVVSRQGGDAQYVWSSSADAKYYVYRDSRSGAAAAAQQQQQQNDYANFLLVRGTCVSLHLKQDATEFLEEFKLRELIKKYSQFIAFPIYLKTQKKTAASEKQQQPDAAQAGDSEEDPPASAGVSEGGVFGWEHLNVEKALWLRAKEEVSASEYESLYRSLALDWSQPLAWVQFAAEGEVAFKGVLFVPERAPADVFAQYFSQKLTNVRLYVRRVLVADAFAEGLLPKYLHFVRGVVDSDDLPLNVAREQLQQHKLLATIARTLVKKTLELLKKMHNEHTRTLARKRKISQQLAAIDAKNNNNNNNNNDNDNDNSTGDQDANTTAEKEKEKEGEEGEEAAADAETLKKQLEEVEKQLPTKYSRFYKEFSKNLMLGCYEDEENRRKIAQLLQFYTSKSQQEPVALETYVKRMQPQQQAIYYAAGENIEQLLQQPQMQIFLKKDLEVIFLLESMDEPCIQRLGDFEGKKFESVQKGSLSLEETAEEKSRFAQLTAFFAPLVAAVKAVLGPRVSAVAVSKRLVEAPCAVVASQWGYSAAMEKVMKSQTFADPLHLKMMKGQKVFELNPHHKLVQHLLQRVKDFRPSSESSAPAAAAAADKTAAKAKANEKMSPQDAETVQQLFNAALLASGFDVEEPGQLAETLYKSISTAAGIDPANALNDQLDLPDLPADASHEKSEKNDPEEDDIFKNLNLPPLDETDPQENLKDEL